MHARALATAQTNTHLATVTDATATQMRIAYQNRHHCSVSAQALREHTPHVQQGSHNTPASQQERVGMPHKQRNPQSSLPLRRDSQGGGAQLQDRIPCDITH